MKIQKGKKGKHSLQVPGTRRPSFWAYSRFLKTNQLTETRAVKTVAAFQSQRRIFEKIIAANSTNIVSVSIGHVLNNFENSLKNQERNNCDTQTGEST